MLTIRKILVPVDFSDSCKGAMGYAQFLAKHFGSEITVLHVAEPLEGMLGLDPSSAPVTDFVRNRHAQHIRELESYLLPDIPDAGLKRSVIEGDPAIEIIRFVNRENIDLIVMPTHGYGPIRQFLLGSVTAKILHDAKCPVWTGVHMEGAAVPEAYEIRTIGCAVDIGPQARSIMSFAAEMAAAWSANLKFFHVAPHISVRDFDAGQEARLREQLAPDQAAIGAPSDLEIGYGNVALTVEDLAKRYQTDVLVIGRSHRSAGGHLPTNAYGIIRSSPCPVLSV
jgi:nucleotide-binding universal stress UspA family protein